MTANAVREFWGRDGTAEAFIDVLNYSKRYVDKPFYPE